MNRPFSETCRPGGVRRQQEAMLSHTEHIIIALGAGMGIGLFYFAGLWRTVRLLCGHPRPFRLLALSYAGRLLPAMGGFYLLLRDGWLYLAAALAGFILVRTALMKILGKFSFLPWKGAAVWK